MNPRLKYLENKRLFAEWTGFPLSELEEIAANPEKYYQKRMVGKKKPREAEVPVKMLKVIQSKIKELLDEFPSPSYRHCGLKGRSYKTNAEVHSGSRSLCSMDIKSYYKSSKREHVFRFLHYNANIAADVAWLITDLVTYKGFVPTGSPSSQAIAFWSHIDTFNKISESAQQEDHQFSLYVDDMGFSSKHGKIHGNTHLKIGNLLKKTDLKLKRSKVKYSKNLYLPFEITGTIAHPAGKVLSPNRLKKKLFDGLDLVGRNISLLEEKEFRSLIGTLRSIRNLEPNSFPSLYGKFLQKEKELNRQQAQRLQSLKHKFANKSAQKFL